MGPGRSFLVRHSLRESGGQRTSRPESSRLCTVVGFPHIRSNANSTCCGTWPVGVTDANSVTNSSNNVIANTLSNSDIYAVTNGFRAATNASPAHTLLNDVHSHTLTNPHALPREDPEQRYGPGQRCPRAAPGRQHRRYLDRVQRHQQLPRFFGPGPGEISRNRGEHGAGMVEQHRQP